MQPTSNYRNDEEDSDLAFQRPGGGGGGKRLAMNLLSRWYWIVLGVILGGGGALYYLSKAPKLYSSSCTLLVKEQTASVLGKDQTEEINMRSTEAMNTIAERLKRQVLLERIAGREDVRSLQNIVPDKVQWLPDLIVEWLGGTTDAVGPTAASSMPPAALAGAIGSWMSISIRRGTRLLDVTVRHPSPEAVKVLADAICLEYIAEISGHRSSGRTGTIQVLAEKSEESRKSLQGSQKAFSAYQRALGSHEELQLKEKSVEELARRYRAKHPELISGLAQVAALQARFLADFDVAVKSGTDMAFWKESEASLKALGGTLPEQLENARRILLSRTAVLKSEIQSQESVFNAMLTRMEQVSINQTEVESEVEISNLAPLPGSPVSPIGSKVVGMGLFAGAAFGGLVALISIRQDNRFHTVMQLEELLEQPVLAAISRIDPAKVVKRGDSPGAEVDLALVEEQKRWDPHVIFRHGQSLSNYAEMFRVLRASITLIGPEDRRKVTLFTSSIPGEGKTLVSVNFALAAAAQGKRVLLIDFDLRRPTVHKILGFDRATDHLGVTGFLSGKSSFEDSIVRKVDGGGLDVMHSGDRTPNPGELLNSSLLESLVALARDQYDVVVLDTAPLLAVPDTRILASYVDNVCLVVRAKYVARGATQRVMRLLASDRTPLAGLILNAFSEKRSLISYNYSYGYYSYSRSGTSYGNAEEAYGERRK